MPFGFEAYRCRLLFHPDQPDKVEAIRAYVTVTTLTQVEIVARLRVSTATMSTSDLPLRAQRGRGHPIGPETVETARALVEGTGLPQAVIAALLGIGRATLGRWGKARGWRRPPEAPTFLRPRRDGGARPARYRSLKGRPYAADAVGAAKILLTGTLLSQAAIAARLGVGSAWVFRLLHRKGWTRPAVPRGSRRFSAFLRTAPVATAGDRRGRPYAPETVAAARELYQAAGLSTPLIAARVGVSEVTLARWAREKGWVRPRDLPDAHKRDRARNPLPGGERSSRRKPTG